MRFQDPCLYIGSDADVELCDARVFEPQPLACSNQISIIYPIMLTHLHSWAVDSRPRISRSLRASPETRFEASRKAVARPIPYNDIISHRASQVARGEE
jgi:hypothetical protein